MFKVLSLQHSVILINCIFEEHLVLNCDVVSQCMHSLMFSLLWMTSMWSYGVQWLSVASWCQCLLNLYCQPWPLPWLWSHVWSCLSSSILGYVMGLILHRWEQDSWLLPPVPRSTSLSTCTIHPTISCCSLPPCYFLDRLAHLFLDHASLIPSSS